MKTKRIWTKPPSTRLHRVSFLVATAHGTYGIFATHRDAMDLVLTGRSVLLNPTIYRVREVWTRTKKQP